MSQKQTFPRGRSYLLYMGWKPSAGYSAFGGRHSEYVECRISDKFVLLTLGTVLWLIDSISLLNSWIHSLMRNPWGSLSLERLRTHAEVEKKIPGWYKIQDSFKYLGVYVSVFVVWIRNGLGISDLAFMCINCV